MRLFSGRRVVTGGKAQALSTSAPGNPSRFFFHGTFVSYSSRIDTDSWILGPRASHGHGSVESQMLTVPKRLLVLVESLQKVDALPLINKLQSAQLGRQWGPAFV